MEDSLDTTLIFLVLVAFAAGALFVYLILSRSHAVGGSPQMAELGGRLSQMAESQAAAQTHLSERLQAQERALAKFLEERLSDVTRRVGESLEKSSEKTQTSMVEIEKRLAVIDAAQKNISELSKEVVSLQDILSNKQARGAFGEEQLEAIIRDQLPPSYYEFQASLSNRNRVDCLIKMPPPLGPLCVDAKFPREDYDALRAAGGDKAAYAQAQRAFASAIMKHVRDIADKYIVPGETAEAALMFVPSEAVYAEIYETAPDIVDKARRSRVFIVSPTTLWAVLNTMRAVLKDVRMREQAGVIQKEVLTLLDDVARLGKRVDSLETHFNQAEKDIREIHTSVVKITRRGERITSLEIEDEEPLEPESLPSSSDSGP